ncbi:probable aquaporin NIP5-1 isoform X2 [Papaver somniferum]|uniref:probable aquaporin NIP5-1 isoform X2 n=1 Tax=Papaver somniferum TaxID=3469 RepID=UPI000E6FC272|nr:probable aquaporin NIP5-1 isoform X2 [Papaver somniferum]
MPEVDLNNGIENSSATPPATPGTPTPLMSSLRIDSLSYERERKSMPRGKCFPVESWTPNHMCVTDLGPPDVSLGRKLGAEFVGTFILMFAASAGPILNQKYDGVETLIGNAACAGLAVMVLILSTGHISGAHFNPSLTIAFAAFRHFPWTQVPAYILAQVGELAGIAVGATVMLNILISGPASGGSMNPVRTLGPAVASGNYKAIWVYIIAPTLGALAGSGIYTLIKLHDVEGDPPRPVRSFRR